MEVTQVRFLYVVSGTKLYGFAAKFFVLTFTLDFSGEYWLPGFAFLPFLLYICNVIDTYLRFIVHKNRAAYRLPCFVP